ATRSVGQAHIEGARLLAGQTKESLAALAGALREGFATTSRALIGGLTALGQAQREAAIESAEIVFRGLERMAASQTEGFAQLVTAIREGDIVHAISTYAGIRGIGRQQVEAAQALKSVISSQIGSLSPAQKESAAVNTLKLFDVVARLLPAEELSAAALAPPNVLRPIVEAEVNKIKGALEPSRERSSRVIHLEPGNCLFGSKGPPQIVEKIMREDGMYERCSVARAAMTRSWHGIWALHKKHLEDAGCPLPNSLGLVQRFLWRRTCDLADGQEHKRA
ncbi:MAG TPA: hypothetical protein VFF86_03075, partial [Candidatus Methylomirabilis sp.]|nr:hypothetical protein [Candidatus Methylomirabilis sp.]